MSEFTAGVLFLKPNLSQVRQQMHGFPLQFVTRELNAKWCVMFIEGDNYEYPPVKPKLVEMSQDFPLLFFQHPEDHGWGYAVYVDGAEVASLWVSYELSFNLTRELAEQRYPQVKDYYVHEFFNTWQILTDEVKTSITYRDAIAQQYANQNFQRLQVFGLNSEAIKTLVGAISPETYLNFEKLLAQAQIFKEVLGINEMARMSYHYVEMNDNAE